MLTEPEWAEAENAFLRLSAELTYDEHSVRFESSQPARRMNGVRIVDVEALDEEGWRAELDRHAQAFATRQMPLSVQLALPATGEHLPGEWRPTGPEQHHVATDITDFAQASELRLRLETVETDRQVDLFADMMMVDRIPDHLHAQARTSVRALMRVATDNPTSTMMLAYDGDTLVAQLALIEATGEHCSGYCVSTLSVAKASRGQGYMKAIYATIADSWQGWLYGQILDGKPTMAYRARFPSTRLLATVRRFERVDDPYGDRSEASSDSGGPKT